MNPTCQSVRDGERCQKHVNDNGEHLVEGVHLANVIINGTLVTLRWRDEESEPPCDPIL